nr:MAG TPA: hypothetical protein [Caudoviricetes sp.]
MAASPNWQYSPSIAVEMWVRIPPRSKRLSCLYLGIVSTLDSRLVEKPKILAL